MKRNFITLTLAFSLILSVNIFTACQKDSNADLPVPENDSITMEAGYANDVYYSLSEGVVATVYRTDWDIAFGVDPQTSAILINEAAGVELKVYPTTQGWSWSDPVDVTNFDQWDNLFNPDTTWDDGAFGANASGVLNYGWGDYNTVSHNIEGSALYIIKTRSGAMKKIFISMKYSAEQRYTFKFEDLNTKAEYDVDLDCSDSNANFVYYSLDNNTRIDREPDKSLWDLVFTKYIDNTINYNVTGVLSNTGVKVAEKDGSTFNNVTWSDEDFSENINVVGSDWKSFDNVNMAYTVDSEKVFIVKTASGDTYLLNFTGFDYTNGKAVFRKLKK